MAVIVASHRRSGTHLTIDLLRRQFTGCASWKWPGDALDRLYLNFDAVCDAQHQRPMSITIANQLLATVDVSIVKTHMSSFDFNENLKVQNAHGLRLGAHKVIYLIRDVRDVLASQHAYEQEFNPDSRVPFAAYLSMPFLGADTHLKYWVQHAESWIDREDVLIVKFESLLRQTDLELMRIADHLELEPLMKYPLLARPWRSNLRCRFLGRLLPVPEATTVMGRPNAIRPVKWREELNRAGREQIHGQAGAMLIHLGYEEGRDWVDLG